MPDLLPGGRPLRRPLVATLLPDPTNPTPYTLPDNKTRMVFRSHSYKSSGNNEMTFEDATSAENQFFNASKDQTTNVVNNATRSIGADQSVSVGQNASTTVGSNSTTEVGGSMNISVGGTGAGASAMMAPLMGLAGMTSGLLSQAMGAAGGAAGGGGMGASPGLSLMSSAMGMVPAIAGGAIGVLSGAGQSAQTGVVSPSSPLFDAGTALAGAGSGLGAAVGSLFGMSGMLNVSVANTRTDSIGVSHAMQVGTSQAINIGVTKNENVGQAHTHEVAITPLEGGLLFRAGRRPVLGDTNRRDVPSLYREVGKILSAHRVSNYGARGYLRVPTPFDAVKESQEWLARFDLCLPPEHALGCPR